MGGGIFEKDSEGGKITQKAEEIKKGEGSLENNNN